MNPKIVRGLLIGLMSLFCSCINDDVAPAVTVIDRGDALPRFDVTMNTGRRVKTEDLRGSSSVIVLFTVSCPDCRRFLPELQKFHYRKPEIPVVLIAREDTEKSISEYWQQHSLTLEYSPQADRTVYNLFAKEGVPRVYVADATLTVTHLFDDSNAPSAEELADLFN